MTEELLCLARRPMKSVITYEGYISNGFRFHTRRSQKRKTQNSGVMVKGDNESGDRDSFCCFGEGSYART